MAGLYTTSNMTGGLSADRRLTGSVKPAWAGRVDITTCVVWCVVLCGMRGINSVYCSEITM